MCLHISFYELSDIHKDMHRQERETLSGQIPVDYGVATIRRLFKIIGLF